MPTEYFDINKFHKGWGLIVFPISMTRIANAQNAEAHIEYLRKFIPKIVEPKRGVHFLYTEGLYMNMPGSAYEMKNSYLNSMVAHANAFKKLLKKNQREMQIHEAFSFDSWFQMHLSHPDVLGSQREIKQFYETNDMFRSLVAEDAAQNKKILDDHQLSFFLEEHTFAYLLLNGQIKLRNDFVKGREEWILLAYPGMPPKAQIYLVQNDPLSIGKYPNPYKGQYDLVSRKFIDYSKPFE